MKMHVLILEEEAIYGGLDCIKKKRGIFLKMTFMVLHKLAPLPRVSLPHL